MKSDPTKSMPVGLASNPDGVAFRCGSCEFFDDGKCWNKNLKLNGKAVKPQWCCNLFRHSGMMVIVR